MQNVSVRCCREPLENGKPAWIDKYQFQRDLNEQIDCCSVKLYPNRKCCDGTVQYPRVTKNCCDAVKRLGSKRAASSCSWVYCAFDVAHQHCRVHATIAPVSRTHQVTGAVLGQVGRAKQRQRHSLFACDRSAQRRRRSALPKKPIIFPQQTNL